MYTLKLIFVPNFSSLGWFSFSSTDSWRKLIKKLNGIFLINMPNFRTLGGFSFSSAFTAVISCWQLKTVVSKKNQMGFHLLPICDMCVKIELWRLLGGLARECDANCQTDANRQTDPRRQMKIELTQPYLAGAGACLRQIEQSRISPSYIFLWTGKQPAGWADSQPAGQTASRPGRWVVDQSGWELIKVLKLCFGLSSAKSGYTIK